MLILPDAKSGKSLEEFSSTTFPLPSAREQAFRFFKMFLSSVPAFSAS